MTTARPMRPPVGRRPSRGRGSLGPRLAIVALLGASLVAACSAPGSSGAPGRLAVVTTSSVFADLVAQVGGDSVNVTSLVPKNGDVHTFEPRPSDIRAVAAARLLVMNGLGLDDWLRKTITNAALTGTPLLVLSDAVPADRLIRAGSGDANPHLWLDGSLARLYVEAIRVALSKADPAHAAAYASAAMTYGSALGALDASIRSTLGAIPAADRRIVTFHDAFPYFARAYGLEVVGVAVRAPGQDPSAGETADLIAAIRGAGVRAIFSERQFPTRLVDQLAAETGVKVVSNLYSDSLGDDPVTSYEGLMRWDADRVTEALR